jgi:hypothetical protein
MNTLELLEKVGFSGAEALQLRALRRRYLTDGFVELLSDAERRRLEFVRWLVQQGRMSS